MWRERDTYIIYICIDATDFKRITYTAEEDHNVLKNGKLVQHLPQRLFGQMF